MDSNLFWIKIPKLTSSYPKEMREGTTNTLHTIFFHKTWWCGKPKSCNFIIEALSGTSTAAFILWWWFHLSDNPSILQCIVWLEPIKKWKMNIRLSCNCGGTYCSITDIYLSISVPFLIRPLYLFEILSNRY